MYLGIGIGDAYGSLWIPIDSYGSLWIPMDPYGFLWIPMDPYGFLWIPMDSYGSLWIPIPFPPWGRPRRAGPRPAPARRGCPQGGEQKRKKRGATLNSGKKHLATLYRIPNVTKTWKSLGNIDTFEPP